MNRNIISVILIVLAVGIFFTFTQERFAEFASIESVNAGYLTAINNSVDLIKTRDQVLTEYNSISDEDKARLNTLLPDNVDNVRLIIDVNAIAARHGISLKGLSAATGNSTSGSTQSTTAPAPAPTLSSGSSDLSASTNTATTGTVSLSFNFSSSYANAVAFLKDLEASLRILDTSHLTLTTNSQAGGYDFSVQLTTYWLTQ